MHPSVSLQNLPLLQLSAFFPLSSAFQPISSTFSTSLRCRAFSSQRPFLLLFSFSFSTSPVPLHSCLFFSIFFYNYLSSLLRPLFTLSFSSFPLSSFSLFSTTSPVPLHSCPLFCFLYNYLSSLLLPLLNLSFPPSSLYAPACFLHLPLPHLCIPVPFFLFSLKLPVFIACPFNYVLFSSFIHSSFSHLSLLFSFSPQLPLHFSRLFPTFFPSAFVVSLFLPFSHLLLFFLHPLSS